MNITKKTWFLPALLGGVVSLLVLSTRRSATATPSTTKKPGTTGTSSSTPGTDTPDSTTKPDTTTSTTKPPDTTTKPPATEHPEVILPPGSILDVYKSLMAAMQADIHSVDPALLREVSRKLRAVGRQTEAVLMMRRAKCADEVYNEKDLDFFPLSCAPPEHVIFDSQSRNPLVTTQAASALLQRYANAMSYYLYANVLPADLVDKQTSSINVATLDALVSELMAANLSKEAENLRARRDQLYQMKFDYAMKHLDSQQQIDHAYATLKELNESGYQGLGSTLRPVIEARQQVLSRNFVCNSKSCVVFGKPYRQYRLTALEAQTPVTVLGSQGEWSHILYDGGPPEGGWVHTTFLAPIAA